MAGSVVAGSALPPSASATHTSALAPGRKRMKAILDPSGENTGNEFRVVSLVSAVAPSVGSPAADTGVAHRLLLMERAPYASRVPSREMARWRMVLRPTLATRTGCPRGRPSA